MIDSGMTIRQVRHDDTRLPPELTRREIRVGPTARLDARPQRRADASPLRAPLVDYILEHHGAFSREELEKMTDEELAAAYDGTRAGESKRSDARYAPPRGPQGSHVSPNTLRSAAGPLDPRALYTPPSRRR